MAGGESTQQQINVYSRKNFKKKAQQNFNSDILQSNNSLEALNPGQLFKTVFETEKIQIEELDIPITLRKGVRSCTVHPLSNFVKYNHLSNSV